MNKQLIISIASILIGGVILGGVIYFKSTNKKEMCPLDTMVCPDGTTVPRSGPNCEFGICKISATHQDVKASREKPLSSDTAGLTPNNPAIATESPNAAPLSPRVSTAPNATKNTTVLSTLVNSVTVAVSSIFKTIDNAVTSTKEPTPTSDNNTPSNTETPTSTSTLNEERLTVVNNKIVDQSGNVVASIPASISLDSGTSTWETHTVNAIEVGSSTPVIDGVPVVGATGKYYISENAFGSQEKCEFSNKIFILDVIAGTKTLLYEENASTLIKDDPRACNSEIFLLATEAEKLIIKYHTINTNMICESTWSEPDKTWYLDVSNLASSMRHYEISPERYSQAEQDETQCRANLPPTN